MHNKYANYPDEWWLEIPAAELAIWEISPHKARRNVEVILSKRTELGAFSNFAATAFELDGHSYASLEGFWQSLKFAEGSAERFAVEQMIGHEAKRAGDQAKLKLTELGIDWITYQGRKIFPYSEVGQREFYELVLRATKAKLLFNPALGDLLLKTGDLRLLPDHEVVADAPLAHRYFDIWMKLRSEL